MKFRPLHDRVVVKRIDAEGKSAGGMFSIAGRRAVPRPRASAKRLALPCLECQRAQGSATKVRYTTAALGLTEVVEIAKSNDAKGRLVMRQANAQSILKVKRRFCRPTYSPGPW
jgi:hypothetical protein